MLNFAKKMNCAEKIPSLQFGIFIFGLICFFVSRVLTIQTVSVKKYLIAPPPGIEHASFGFQEVMADSLWIRSIQDFDYCDQPPNQQQCRGQSWLYQMLDTTTNLSPHFRMPYAVGAVSLSVLISDIEGATQLFEKGLKVFPKDWPLAYRAAYHYLYEVQDRKRAAELLVQAHQNGGPPWLPSLAARLYVDSGNTELAEALLQEMIEQRADPKIIERMRQKIDSIKSRPKHSEM